MNTLHLFFKGFLTGFKRFGSMIVESVNFVLLIIVYIIGVGLSALIGKLSKKQFLNLKPKKTEKTYWKKRDNNKTLESYYNQF